MDYLGNRIENRFGYLIVSNYIAIYKIEKTTINIIRIRNGRTDYNNYLFS